MKSLPPSVGAVDVKDVEEPQILEASYSPRVLVVDRQGSCEGNK